MPLSDKELRDVLLRADEIHRAKQSGSARDAELQRLISAAEEAGYNRAAVELALRERLELPSAPPAVGELTFARSTDNKYYAAHVVSHSPEGTRVRFVRGGEHVVAPDQLRPGSLLPGNNVWVNWPAWGNWRCVVMEYAAGTGRVKLSDRWGWSRWFPLSEVWLEKPGAMEGTGSTTVHLMAMAAAGAVFGSLITYLLLR